MQAIKSYLSLIDPQLLNHVTGKPKQFIRLYQETEYISEEVFMHRICAGKHSEGYYRDLKSRTIKILQSLVVVSNPKGDSLMKKKYKICQKNFLIVHELLKKEQRIEGIRLAKEAYSIAIEYDFTLFACEFASILYYHFAYFGEKTKRNIREAEEYELAMDHYAYSYLAEKKVERYFCKTIGAVTRSANPSILLDALEQTRDCRGASLKCQVLTAILQVNYGFHIGDYHLVVESCTDALAAIKNQKGVRKSQYFSFYKDLGVAQMAIGKYDKATEKFNLSIQYVRPRSYNDYIVRFYQTMNALRSGQYQLAYAIYRQNCKCRNENIRQHFAIIEAYLHFMVYTGHLKMDKPFRMRKYLNDTFKGQTDKKGDNISILIAELLMYFAKDRGKFIDRVEAIRDYSYRYLKGEDTQRAKWFIRIICMLPRANFHPIALARLAKKQIANLETNSLSVGQNFAIEIIPFGDLLNMIMIHLKRKIA